MGYTVKEAKSTDFYDYFLFKENETGKTDDGTTIITNMCGRYPAQMALYVNKEGRIVGSSLVMPRKWMDKPESTLSARDVGKSFLEFAVPSEDLKAASPLIKQIYFGAPNLTIVDAPKLQKEGSKETINNPNQKLMKVGPGPLKKGDTALGFVGEFPKLPNPPTEIYLAFTGKKAFAEEKHPHCLIKIESRGQGEKETLWMTVISRKN
jgi:hypothetical protein